MTATLLILGAVLGTGPAADPAETPRKPSIIAPSLPQLTREEEDKLDEIIDRFMLADTGRLRGTEARQAVKDFEALKPEAVPALIRGLNKAAGLQHSCPVLTISKNLNSFLMASNDPQLLEFARDEIGAGVGPTRYAGTLQDLRTKVMLRKNALARRPPPPPRGLRELTTSELVKAASTERGPKLGAVLTELETRKGKEVLAGLSVAAASYDRDTRKLGRDLLDRHLARQSEATVREKLGDDNPEIRAAAARVAGARFPSLAGTLVELLADPKPEVRESARQGLVKVSRNTRDFGPRPDDSVEAQKEAQRRWRDWLEKTPGGQ
jgi:hypothetical protein